MRKLLSILLICFSISLHGQSVINATAVNLKSFRLTTSTSNLVLQVLGVPTPEKMRITSTGNIGIGTSSPAFKLDVNGKIGVTGIQFGNIPVQGTYPNSFFVGTGGNQLTPSGGFSGWGNTALGIMAGDSITTGYNNTLIASLAGKRLKTGYYNTLIGIAAGASLTSGTENTFIGMAAGTSCTGDFNTAVGSSAGLNITTGQTNSLFGNLNGFNINTGVQNTNIGYRGMQSTTNGNFNDGSGYRNLESNVSGNGNTAHGLASLRASLSDYNSAIGFYSGASITTGSNNFFAGNSAGYNASQKVNAVNSIAIGTNSYTTRDSQFVAGATFIKETLLQGSVGISKSLTEPVASAILDISSTTQGVLLPRMTKAQRDAIASPATGLAIFQTDNTAGVRFYNGTNWVRFTETVD